MTAVQSLRDTFVTDILRQLQNAPISSTGLRLATECSPICLTYPESNVDQVEPATPCLQSKLGNTMWLILLTFTYVT